MGWSMPDPQPAEPVLGDPASVAALGAALHRAADELGQALEHLRPEHTTSRRHSTRVKALRASAAPLGESMHRSGTRLTEHATEMADALGLSRRVVERAESVGLDVDGPTITVHRGVHGIADPSAEAARAEVHSRLQHVLDAILLDLDSARDDLREALAAERIRVLRR